MNFIEQWLKKYHIDSPQAEIDKMMTWQESPDQIILHLDDAEYPARLREIHDPPPLLFIKGNPAILNVPQIAIVGCRKMSPYGAENAYQFAQALSEIGLAITSGLALGIDTLAHQGALAARGATIAVLGTGLQYIYPAQNKALAESISKTGALISEFPLGALPHPYHFPKRNRIISALSLGVLVIEAAEKSGSLITARFALEQNREIFAIPGSIHSPGSKGCHQLIKEGAILVESLSDLLVHVKEKLQTYLANPASFSQSETQRRSTDRTPRLQSKKKHVTPIKKQNEHPLLNLFSRDISTPLDVLLAETGASIESLNAELLFLELSGDIKMVAGGYVLT